VRVTHVITGLGVGGAESMLYKLLTTLDRRKFEPAVVSLSADLALAGRIRSLDVPVTTLGMRPSLLSSPRALAMLYRLLRRQRPDLVQTWLYHGDLLGGVAGKLAGIPVIWNIRSSTLDPSYVSARTRGIVRLCGRLSKRVPKAIVSCSHVATALHVASGYEPARFRYIPNGANIEVFRPDAECRTALRRELAIDEGAPVVGMVARVNPQKDHVNLLAAMKVVQRAHPEAILLLCGSGADETNASLADEIGRQGLDRRNIRLLGLRSDIEHVMPALDIHALSSSWGEAFPNVLVEAMACGVPCVATDIGDSAAIIGDTGRSVASRDPEALAAAICALLNLPPAEMETLRARARERAVTHYSLRATVAEYERLYDEIGAHAE
jgi:glycosyltransferase involved in cell wall biosynthesis